MNTEKDETKPQLDELFGVVPKGSAKDQAITDLQEKTALRRHAPGWIGKLFGGQVNASTNIIGAVAVGSLLMIAVFGVFGNSASALEVAKATLFLAIGYFSSKKIDDNRSD